jgi:pyrroline-5-carboxylate reductase
MADKPGDILLVGCGRMGSALVQPLVQDRRILIFDPIAPAPAGTVKIGSLGEACALLSPDATVLLAVKPQIFDEVALETASLAHPKRRIVSIIAGISISRMESVFGSNVPLVRAMPNTPSALGVGMTAAIASRAARGHDLQIVQSLFEAVGRFLWLEREADLDLVTAVSGSGPAYFFRFTEALAEAATALGLDQDEATLLARQTLIGAARLAEVSAMRLDELRAQVTSPGGTTAAALAAMELGNLIDQLATSAIGAGMHRSRELGQEQA